MADRDASVTRELVKLSRGFSFGELPAEARSVAKQCLLDWMGVTLAGSREPLAGILRQELARTSADGDATLLGERPQRAPALVAALVNGAASHALDFDDTHMVMSGHPSVPVVPAALALAEARSKTGRDLLTAIVAGVELECTLGALMNPGHYAAGFHATGTLGTLGAAAACCRLLELDEEGWLVALGLAGTQAAGLKSSFGTMAKPLHAGKAAHDGLLSAILAAGGFTANPAIVECKQGLADALAGGPLDASSLAGSNDRFYIRDTLFKFHAACYLTHSAIEGARAIREGAGIDPTAVDTVRVEVPPSSLAVCAIEQPRTGLEGKFSLRATIALALLGDDTGDLATYADERMTDADLVSLRDRVQVIAKQGVPPTATPVSVRVRGGERHDACVDVGAPAPDLDEQGRRLEAKFQTLATPVVGAARARDILGLVAEAEGLTEMAPLVAPLTVSA